MKILRLALLLVVLCCIANPAAVHTLTITGNNTAQTISTTNTSGAHWVQFVAPAANSGTSRVGDTTVTSTIGIPLAPGSGMMFPAFQSGGTYSLGQLKAYVATGDTLSVTWAF